MPKVVTYPDKLRPFLWHGVEIFDLRNVQTIGSCPFCRKEGKFGVNSETGAWKCWSCDERSAEEVKEPDHIRAFLYSLWKRSDEATSDYSELAENRGLKFPETLSYWGAAQSIIDKCWLLPGYDVNGKLCQLYRYSRAGERMRLFPTPTLPHGFHTTSLSDLNRPTVFVAEGPWDGMVLWETLGRTKRAEEGFTTTSNPSLSLLAENGVIAVPGCNTFRVEWLPLFRGKTVTLLYDNDHPRVHPTTGKTLTPAGYAGMRRVARLLAKAGVKDVRYLKWGEGTYNPDLGNGYDVRDHANRE